MYNRLLALAKALVPLALVGASSLPAQGVQPDHWAVWVGAEEESMGVGVPVLALDRDDWATYLHAMGQSGRALRRIEAHAGAIHPSGWGLAAVARSQTWLEANADAVALAAMESRHSLPEAPRRFALWARSEAWDGRGLRGVTPWFALADSHTWRWQASVDWLRLHKLKVRSVEGDIAYEGSTAYDARLRMYRADRNVTGRFLPPSGEVGTGASLSLALQGTPWPGWRVDLRAQDVASRLRWKQLATDERIIDSQIAIRAEDGTLDYAPVIRGKKAIAAVSTTMRTQWQALLGWSPGASTVGECTLRTVRMAPLTQRWLGWQRNAGALRWGAELEPTLGALRLWIGGEHGYLTLATDGRGLSSQYRQIAMGWQWGW
ncbi:hypothetical protein [Candidatus Symbiobacter mobilis]|uniref:Uncharacterized protein n=1 Tax=Candidatus Symbiobacter mobilis CR TaxID=946483 RepID=U5NE90_9BURK|nr:hypothetical protein [Candidatus Symbiobacter mobilis]AGX88543.1 hypothetical protein Cenrod_2489 [Candidatus Symbiobacter mobilis CR]